MWKMPRFIFCHMMTGTSQRAVLGGWLVSGHKERTEKTTKHREDDPATSLYVYSRRRLDLTWGKVRGRGTKPGTSSGG